jgi:hypothetical protein
MKFSKNTIAATFAALLIGGLAISPASAKVHNETGHFDINAHVLNLELKGDFGLKDKTYNAGRAAPTGESQAVSNRR